MAIAGVGAAGGGPVRWPGGGAPPRLRSYDRFTTIAVAAGLEAAAAAGWSADDLAGDRTALALGTAFGSHATNEEYYQGVLGRAAVSPRLFTYTLPSSPLGELSILWKQTGAQDTRCAGWTSGAAALEAALARIRTGAADRALCIGADVPGPAAAAAVAAAAGPVEESAVALALAPAGESTAEGGAGGATVEAVVSAYGTERAADCVRQSLHIARINAALVDRALVAGPATLEVPAAAALSAAGLRAPAASAPDAARAMGAAPLVAAAALAAAPAASWRVATVLTLCYCGAVSSLVLKR